MKKIIITSSVLIISVIIIGIFLYDKKSDKQVLRINPISSNEPFFGYNDIYAAPSYSGDVDALADEVSKQILLQQEYASNHKISSNIPKINNDKIMNSLNALVDQNSGTNNYNPNQSQSKIEFELKQPPNINHTNYDDGIDYYAYRLDYSNREYQPSDLNLVGNSTFFNETMAQAISVSIYMNYETDSNYSNRIREINYIKDSSMNSEEEDKRLQELMINYPKRTKFEQGINLFLENINFNTKLNVPKQINIWNEYSSELFPCHLSGNTLIKNYTELDVNGRKNDYSIKYYCVNLPNVNDYGDLKILFD